VQLTDFLTSVKLLNVILQSNRLLKIENLESLVMLEQLYLSDNGIEVIEGLDTLVGVCVCLSVSSAHCLLHCTAIYFLSHTHWISDVSSSAFTPVVSKDSRG